MKTLEELKSYFRNVKSLNGGSFQASCPCHSDGKPSMTVTNKDNKILIHCHAGCNTADILNATGLTFADLGAETKIYDWRDKIEYATGKQIEDIYHYKDIKGNYKYTKIRFIGKDIRYITLTKDGGYTWGKPKDNKKYLYSMYNFLESIKKGYTIYIVEGEKDAKTLARLGLCGVTAGGVGDWQKEFAKIFTGANVVILPDNDEQGLKLKDTIIKDLRAYAHSIKWVITSQKEKGDVSDYIADGKDIKDLKALISKEKAIFAPWVEVMQSKDGSYKQKINGGLLAHNISENVSYIIIDGVFYVYNNGFYSKQDKNSIKSLIGAYIPSSLRTDNMLNNVYNLLLADLNHIKDFKEVNINESYINFKNGLYNLNTRALEPHNPAILYTRQINATCDINANYKPIFDKFINDLCRDAKGEVDEQKKLLLAEWLGLCISNIYGYRLKKMLILYSPIGNTGKSQYLNLLNHFIGASYISNIPLQNMNEERGRFALGNIENTRLIINGDQSKADIKDSSMLKCLTGGDYVKSESKGQDIKTVLYKGLIINACNDLPYIKDDKGDHLYERMLLIPCLNVIEESKRDTKLLEKMKAEDVAIVNFALSGLHRLIDNNMTFTKVESAAEYMEAYRKDNDTVYSFLEDCNYIITKDADDKLNRDNVYIEYSNYCTDDDRTNMTKKNFSSRMEKITGHKIHRTRVQNIRAWYILGLKKEDFDDWENIPEQVNIFFK